MQSNVGLTGRFSLFCLRLFSIRDHSLQAFAWNLLISAVLVRHPDPDAIEYIVDNGMDFVHRQSCKHTLGLDTESADSLAAEANLIESEMALMLYHVSAPPFLSDFSQEQLTSN